MDEDRISNHGKKRSASFTSFNRPLVRRKSSSKSFHGDRQFQNHFNEDNLKYGKDNAFTKIKEEFEDSLQILI